MPSLSSAAAMPDHHDDNHDIEMEENKNKDQMGSKNSQTSPPSSSSFSSLDLAPLLAALAQSVRALQQGGPSVRSREEYQFQISLPEVRHSLARTQSSLLQTLQSILQALEQQQPTPGQEGQLLPLDELDPFHHQQQRQHAASDHHFDEEEEELGEDDEEEEEFDAEVSAGARLSTGRMMESTSTSTTKNTIEDEAALWEACAEACELLVEQVEVYLQRPPSQLAGTGEGDEDAALLVGKTLQQIQHQIQKSSHLSRYQLMVQGTVPMVKPQETWHIRRSNRRTEPFIPRVHPEKPHAVTPLDLLLRPGNGWDTRWGELISSTNPTKKSNLIGPSHHVAHVYESEIRSFTYRPQQLMAVRIEPWHIPASSTTLLSATWIDTVADLESLSSKLDEYKSQGEEFLEVALDLEAHSYRSFAGMVCLMQITVRHRKLDGTPSSTQQHPSYQSENYLIDTLALHHDLNRALAPILADPAVVKVMHGADSDVTWLQRDFGLYVVNLFDTGRAARALLFPSASYAYLLRHYVSDDLPPVDKSYQLADWRQRPLPAAMQQYAIQDTHYLLDIYDRLKWDLHKHPNTSIEAVLDKSRQVCLIRYAPEPFDPYGYQSLVNRRQQRVRWKKNRTELTTRQEAVLKALWDWRDQTARDHDESSIYVCTPQGLLRIAMACPSSVTALQALFNPIPPLVLECAPDILERIQDALSTADMIRPSAHEENAPDDIADREGLIDDDDDEEEEEDEEVAQSPIGAPSSAFFKPANVDQDSRQQGMMTPVLGTEALYKQAGWMTPQEHAHDTEALMISATATTDEDDPADEGEKPSKMLLVHASNQEFRSMEYSHHSLEFGKGGASHGRSVDGMGTVHAGRDHSQSPVRTTVEEESKQAREMSSRVKGAVLAAKQESLPAVLGLIPAMVEVDEEETGAEQDDDARHSGDADLDEVEEEFSIPRSMREIYRISNRNRRNKKAGSPTPERGVTPTNEKEREELAKAEALLRENGDAVAGYFGDESSPGKRPRTKSNARTGRDSEESVPQDSSNVPSQQDDLAFMMQIGWISNPEEADRIMSQRFGRKSSDGGGSVSLGQVGPNMGEGGDGVSLGLEGSSMSGGTGQQQQLKDSLRQGLYSYGYDYAGVMGTGIGVMPGAISNNPFFAGAALAGGPLAQNFAKPEAKLKKTTSGGGSSVGGGSVASGSKGKAGRKAPPQQQQDRPEKKEGRTFAYRKR